MSRSMKTRCARGCASTGARRCLGHVVVIAFLTLVPFAGAASDHSRPVLLNASSEGVVSEIVEQSKDNRTAEPGVLESRNENEAFLEQRNSSLRAASGFTAAALGKALSLSLLSEVPTPWQALISPYTSFKVHDGVVIEPAKLPEWESTGSSVLRRILGGCFLLYGVSIGLRARDLYGHKAVRHSEEISCRFYLPGMMASFAMGAGYLLQDSKIAPHMFMSWRELGNMLATAFTIAMLGSLRGMQLSSIFPFVFLGAGAWMQLSAASCASEEHLRWGLFLSGVISGASVLSFLEQEHEPGTPRSRAPTCGSSLGMAQAGSVMQVISWLTTIKAAPNAFPDGSLLMSFVQGFVDVVFYVGVLHLTLKSSRLEVLQQSMDHLFNPW